MSKPYFIAVSLFIFLSICAWADENRYVLANGYICLSGTGGIIDTLKFDPTGKGRYGLNIVKSIYAGEIPPVMSAEPAQWKLKDKQLELKTIKFYINPRKTGIDKWNKSVRLEEGHTLGQSINVETDGFVKLGICCPTWYTKDSGMTLRLKRGGPAGEIVAENKFEKVPDNSWQYLTFIPQPKGKYYIEMLDPIGTIGWWSNDRDVYAPGEAYVDGKESKTEDRTFEAICCDIETGNLNITLIKNKLECKITVPQPQKPPLFKIVTPWLRDGYEVRDKTKILFSRFYTDKGQYVPIEQYKRRVDSRDFPLQAQRWVYATGTSNFDLKIYTFGRPLVCHMDAESMTFPLSKSLTLEVLPHSEAVPSYYPVFFSSNHEFDKLLNRFYYERAFSYPPYGKFPEWMEWQGLILYWTGLPFLKAYEREHLLRYKIDNDGYVYTWGDKKGWPFPDNTKYDTRHFNTNSMYILGCWRYYSWTKDRDFLEKNIERLRRAMEFQLKDCQGEDGLLIMMSPDHDGTTKSVPSNYWDDIPFGYKSAYENIYFYASLKAMAELEREMNNSERAKYFLELMEKTKKAYNENFWNPQAGRYIGCIDIKGEIHDYGFTYVNTEAMTYCLADEDKARRIYRWMEKEPTSSGEPDTYKYRFAPRVNTIDCKDWWYLEGKAEIPSQPFDTHCENGGAILYTSFYDIMARAKYLGPDNAFRRLREILDRYKEPDKLCGGTPLYHGEVTGWQVGTDIPFPESGLVPSSFLYAFLGISADTEGLKIRPNLPKALKFAGVKNLVYRNLPVEIKVTNYSVEIICKKKGYQFRLKKKIKPGETLVFREPPKPVKGFPPLLEPAKAQTRWIWYPEARYTENLDLYFRKKVVVPKEIKQATIKITADNLYELYINGQLVGSDGDLSDLEEYEIRKYLRPGENTMAIHIHNYDGPGGLILWGKIITQKGKKIGLKTDKTWKVSKEAPKGWESPDFDDFSWPGAEELGAPPLPPWHYITSEETE